MKIKALTIKDFKRISDVKIEPGDAAVIIGGRNRQGKSTALDAMEAALLGARAAPKDPIRHGAKSARIVLETDTGMVVTREFDSRGTHMKVKGGPTGSPQAVLNALADPVSFDPLAFDRLSPKDQAAKLRELSGVDTSKLEAKRADIFKERTDVKRDFKAATSRLDAAVFHAEAPAELVSVAALSEELTDAVAHNAVCDAANTEAEAAQVGEVAWVNRYNTKRDELAEIEAGMKKAEATATRLAVAARDMERKDTDEINAAIASAEGVNAQVRANEARVELAYEVDAAGEVVEALTDKLGEIDEKIADMTAAAKYPIDGLSVDDDGVSYRGVTFAQASDAERIEVCVAIGLALNKGLKVLRVHDGSLLDDESLALVVKLAEEADAQVWIERVGKGDECTVIIEDGAIA